MPSLDKRSVDLEPWQDPRARPYLVLDNVSKAFSGVQALHHVSLSVFQGEFFSLLGPSGCGKTTLLRMMGGFEQPDTGAIYIDNTNMSDKRPFERPVNMMFQSYALFPHMTAEQNVAFGLKQQGVPKDEIGERVINALNLVRMGRYAGRKPNQLSGGQRQRVALARSLVLRPKVLLLDEPLAALDKVLRRETQFELVNIQEKVGITFVMVTHDQEEAMTMSTRMAVMDEGRVRQVGTPQELYEYPNSGYVADFLGTTNMFEGIVVEDEADHVLVRSEQIGCDLYINHASSAPVGAQVSVSIRPEKIIMSKEPLPMEGRNVTKGQVDEIAYHGDISTYHIELQSGQRVLVTMPNMVRLAERPINWEDEVYLHWRPENGVVLFS
ncbi:MAG: ABC transporter ATP-binding protein [Alphaproteobacteria bacterium]